MNSTLQLVVSAFNLTGYPRGGGHWSFVLQYLLGLESLGHDVTLVEPLPRSTSREMAEAQALVLADRMNRLGFRGGCCTTIVPGEDGPLPEFFSKNRGIPEVITGADLLWNIGASLTAPLARRFRRRVLIDVDPGHLQLSCLEWDLGLDAHDAFLTVGLNMDRPDCDSPPVGRDWRPFRPFVFLPAWAPAPDPGADAAFGSVTQWNWGEIRWGDRLLGLGKREAYLRYLDLPGTTRRTFKLAANIHPGDSTGDRETLLANGWIVVDPHEIAESPAEYARFIRSCRAEFLCPKPVFRELRTGWISDRSVAFLASGRPVLAEETGFSRHLPVGEGLLAFNDAESARSGVAAIDDDYGRHSLAARELAEVFFGSDVCLDRMLEASFE